MIKHGVTKNAFRLQTFIKHVSPKPPEVIFPKPACAKLNRLRTGVGLFCSTAHKWGMVFMAACECGAKEQTVKHVITSCSNYHNLNGARALSDVDKTLVMWLTKTSSAI